MEPTIAADAEQLTLEQVEAAKRIVEKTMRNDSRYLDAGLLGAVVVAMATNFATLQAMHARANSD